MQKRSLHSSHIDWVVTSDLTFSLKLASRDTRDP